MAFRKRREGPRVKEDVACNVIPMVDIMFLLLLFFIIAANQSQTDTEVVELPVASMVIDESKEVTEGAEDQRAVVNVVHLSEDDVICSVKEAGEVCRDNSHWKYKLGGDPFDYSKEGLKGLEAKLKGFRIEYDKDHGREQDSVTATNPSQMPVMINADKAAPYGYIQRVIAVVARLYMFKVQIGAAQLEEEES